MSAAPEMRDERRLAVVFGQLAASDLAGQVAADGGEPCLDALRRDVVDQRPRSRRAPQTCAMPLPIWPAPMTPTVSIMLIALDPVAGLPQRPILRAVQTKGPGQTSSTPALQSLVQLAVRAASKRLFELRQDGRRGRRRGRSRRPGRSALPRPC